MCERNPVHCIVPPHVLREIAERGTSQQQEWAKQTLLSSEQFRGQRLVMAETGQLVTTASATTKQRIVYDAAEAVVTSCAGS